MSMRKSIWPSLLLAVVGFWGMQAFAASPSSLSTDSLIQAATGGGDQAATWFQEWFGAGNLNPMSLGTGFTGTMFNDIFLYLNLGAMVLGSAWFIYVVTAGSVQTAHEGEFLGRRYSSVWLPIRVCVGVSSCAPIFGGWSGLQWMTLVFAFMGSGLGNLATKQVVSGVMQSMAWNVPVAGNVSQPAKEIAAAIAMMNLCRASYNKALNEQLYFQGDPNHESIAALTPQHLRDGVLVTQPNPVARGFGNITSAAQNSWSGTRSYSALHYSMKFGNSGLGKAGVCGRIDLRLDPGNAASHDTTTAIKNAVVTIANKGAADPMWLRIISHGHASAGQDDLALLKGWIDAAANDVQTSAFAALPAINANMDAALGKNLSDFQTSINTGGWPMLGTWFWTVMKLQNEANAAMHGRYFDIVYPEDGYKDVDSKIRASFGQKMQFVGEAFGLLDERYEASSKTNVSSPDERYSRSVLQSFGIGAVAMMISPAGSADGTGRMINPIITMKRLGDALVNAHMLAAAAKIGWELSPTGRAASVATAAGKEIAGAASAIGPSNALMNVAKDIGGQLSSIWELSFYAGLTLAYYIPMVPFISWMSAIFSWMLSIIAGLFAGPVHAMAHMDGEGDGMGNRTSHGYLFMFRIMLQPILMVGGFMAAIVLLVTMGGFVNKVYVNLLFDITQENMVVGAVSIIMYILIYCAICLQIVHRAFDMCHLLPDTVMSFIGAPNDHSQNQMGSMVQGAVGAALATARGVGGPSGAIGGARKQEEAEKRKEGLMTGASRKGVLPQVSGDHQK